MSGPSTAHARTLRRMTRTLRSGCTLTFSWRSTVAGFVLAGRSRLFCAPRLGAFLRFAPGFGRGAARPFCARAWVPLSARRQRRDLALWSSRRVRRRRLGRRRRAWFRSVCAFFGGAREARRRRLPDGRRLGALRRRRDRARFFARSRRPGGCASPSAPTRKMCRSGTLALRQRPGQRLGGALRSAPPSEVPAPTSATATAAAAVPASTLAHARIRRERANRRLESPALRSRRFDAATYAGRTCGNAGVGPAAASTASATPATAFVTFAGRTVGVGMLHFALSDDDRVGLCFAAALGDERFVLRFFLFGDRGDPDRRASLGLVGRLFGQLAQLLGLFGRGERALTPRPRRAGGVSWQPRRSGGHEFGEDVILFVVDVEDADARRVSGVVRRVFDLDDPAFDDRGGRGRIRQAARPAIRRRARRRRA